MNTRKRNGQLLVDGKRLKGIIDEQFAILGYGGLDALYYEMNLHGFVFESSRSYSIEQLESFFKAMFGGAATLMVDRVKKRLATDASGKATKD